MYFKGYWCKQLDLGWTRKRECRDSNLRPVERNSVSLTTRPLSHTVDELIGVNAALDIVVHFVEHSL